MSKYYFKKGDEEFCYTKKYWLAYMDENNIKSLVLIEAKRETNVDHFYCKEFMEVGLKSDGGCGKLCDAYKPRNGKNGRCVNSGYCYEETDNTITLNT